jgi:hypothetical protein
LSRLKRHDAHPVNSGKPLHNVDSVSSLVSIRIIIVGIFTLGIDAPQLRCTQTTKVLHSIGSIR